MHYFTICLYFACSWPLVTPANSAVMSTLTVHCWWEEQTARERISHLLFYAEAKGSHLLSYTEAKQPWV